MRPKGFHILQSGVSDESPEKVVFLLVLQAAGIGLYLVSHVHGHRLFFLELFAVCDKGLAKLK